MISKPPDAFLSYTRFDDRRGDVTAFREHLSDAVREVTGEPFEIFQDIDDIQVGERWSDKLDQMLAEARFFIPILTPSYFNSAACRGELEKFLIAEAKRGREDLVLPIYYIECHVLEESELRAADPLAMIVHDRQRKDWRDLRFQSIQDGGVRRAFEKLARQIARARRHVQPLPSQVIPEPPRPDLSAPTAFRDEDVAPGRRFRDLDAPWCPEMVIIPRGEFVMGRSVSPEPPIDTFGAFSAPKVEGPEHLVRIDYPMAVGAYPITFEEYDRFVEATGRVSPGARGWGRERRPVINVSWYDAKAYVQWLAGETHRPYRLLSEAEWEYACRAGTTTLYWWGDRMLEGQANFGGHGPTTRVGSFPANPWGLYDTHGNVWEWVEDLWHDNYKGAPEDGSAWVAGSDLRRVMRGGSWYNNSPSDLRAVCRSWTYSGGRMSRVGFRVARTLYP